MTFGRELLTNIKCSGRSRSFAKEMSRQPWRCWAQWPAIKSWQRSVERIIEADSLSTTLDLPKNSRWVILPSFRIWSKVERWIWLSGCLMNWLKIFKITVLKCLFLYYVTTIDQFSIEFWCVMKSGLYTTPGNDQLCVWTKKKLQCTS